jgi:hypothetical protein
VQSPRPKSETRIRVKLQLAPLTNLSSPASVRHAVHLTVRISSAPLFLLIPALRIRADTNVILDVQAPSLRPPRPEILPGFWEQYGTWMFLAGALVFIAIGILVWFLVRLKPPAPIPPAAQARQQLEPLRQRAEDGRMLSQVSQIVRRYIAAAFALPPGELTTTELTRTLLDDQKVGPELGGEVIAFLRECDLRKFAPSPPQVSLGAASRAASLIDRAENRVAEFNRLAAEPSGHSAGKGRSPQDNGSPAKESSSAESARRS